MPNDRILNDDELNEEIAQILPAADRLRLVALDRTKIVRRRENAQPSARAAHRAGALSRRLRANRAPLPEESSCSSVSRPRQPRKSSAAKSRRRSAIRRHSSSSGASWIGIISANRASSLARSATKDAPLSSPAPTTMATSGSTCRRTALANRRAAGRHSARQRFAAGDPVSRHRSFPGGRQQGHLPRDRPRRRTGRAALPRRRRRFPSKSSCPTWTAPNAPPRSRC